MFERYTERARRVLFFARYEASEFGAEAIETEHLLLGLAREGRGLTVRLLQSTQASPDRIRAEVMRRVPARERIPTHVEIPFSADMQRTLARAAAESDKLRHGYIGTEHLLLALLSDQNTTAGSILAATGLEYEAVHGRLIELLNELKGGTVATGQAQPAIMGVEWSEVIEQIKRLVDQLAQTPTGSPEALDLAERIKRELDTLKPPFTAAWFSPP